MFFSIIIPLYNRPQEIKELLDSLLYQEDENFEVIVVEDGSTVRAEDIVRSFEDRLDIRYFFKENQGQGFSRNYGFERAKGDFFVVFDSDIIVPPNYLQHVRKGLEQHGWDAFGGPDAAHESFTATQQAISYTMTSPLTTGGIRGNKQHVGVFHPRSFNMGLSRAVWEKTGGFHLSRRSEDIEFSIRMINQGFKVGLIPEAYVYHKRRANLEQFYKQVHAFGKGRIDIYRLYPEELKWVHLLPAVFVVGLLFLLMVNIFNILTNADIAFLSGLACLGNILVLLYTLTLFVHALLTTKKTAVAFKSVLAAYTQFFGYGFGLIENYLNTTTAKRKT